MGIEQAVKVLESFQGESLTKNLADIERRLSGCAGQDLDALCDSFGIDDQFMPSALELKRVAGQINVIIHAAGILKSLGSLLEPDEKIESLSLGAGNTGRQFDLETNFRIAEYKFIDWRGGSEAVRQNGIFKDFFHLAECDTTKKKYLYVVGTEYPMRFLRGGRALSSVLGRYPEILSQITDRYGESVVRVRDYYALKCGDVSICDISGYIGRA